MNDDNNIPQYTKSITLPQYSFSTGELLTAPYFENVHGFVASKMTFFVKMKNEKVIRKKMKDYKLLCCNNESLLYEFDSQTWIKILDEDIFNEIHKIRRIIIYSHPEKLQDVRNFFVKNIFPEYKNKKIEKGIRFIKVSSSGSLSLTNAINTFKASSDFIEKNYNDDFKEVNQYIQEELQQKSNSGLFLLHGLPGTGKTTYIRYLASILKKDFVFLPSSNINVISEPEFLTFLTDKCRGCVLVIEDAENIITDRTINKSQAVPNLLNITDGLLGDLLGISVICTFNQSANTIDSALLRKGRIRAKYEFKKLALNKVKAIYPEADSDMSLADAYNHNDISYNKEVSKLGFNVGAN